MKNKFILFFAVTLLGASLFTGCKKDDETKALTKREMVSRSWKIQEVKNNGTVDNSPLWAEIFFQFNASGTYEVTTPFGPSSGPWEFSADETKMIMDKGTDDEATWNIISLSSTTFKSSYTDDEGDLIETTMVPR